MREYLRSAPKTIPSNYSVVPENHSQPGSDTPGFSCTEEAWDKAKRQESEYYDWEDYMRCQQPTMEHPEYLERASMAASVEDWERTLRKLEPMRR